MWRFLATLIVAGWSEAAITDEIDAMLAELVDEREEISVKRKAFVAQLLGLGTGSACRFSQTPCFKRSISSCAADLGAAHTVDLRQIETPCRWRDMIGPLDVRGVPASIEAPLSVPDKARPVGCAAPHRR